MPGSPTPAPDAPVPSGPRPSAAKEHPFPGSAPPLSGSDSSSSSSSSDSSSSSSSGDSNTPDAGSPPLDDKGDNPRANVRRRLPKVQKLQSDDERAAEDLNIAKFYEQKGDLNAAYLRSKDAVKYQPSDPDAHFALAHIAQKLDKRDEAVAEYNAYLQLAPDGMEIKQAQKALSQLQH
jgi:tetratricopeptide (TPR) repeat protein